MQERSDMTVLIKQHLLRARSRMKQQTDKQRTDRTFEVGDAVFVKLQPYIQSSVAKRACHKLSFRYFGPFVVKERIGRVAYRVQLPETSRIHPVFHVSQLRKALKSGVSASQTLPDDSNQFAIPVQILDTRRKNKANRILEQVLVKWSGDHLDPTWEDREELQARFLCAAAWGQAASEDGGGVSSLPANGPEDPDVGPPSGQLTEAAHKRARVRNPRVHGKDWVNCCREG